MGLKLTDDGSEWTSLSLKELTLPPLASIWANLLWIEAMVVVEVVGEEVGVAGMTTEATDAPPPHTTVVVAPVTLGPDHTPPVSTTERPFKNYAHFKKTSLF